MTCDFVINFRVDPSFVCGKTLGADGLCPDRHKHQTPVQRSVSKQCEHEQHDRCRIAVRDELGQRTWECSCPCHAEPCCEPCTRRRVP